MIVEALWRGIKREILVIHNRPSVDITKALPPLRLKFEEFLTECPSVAASPSRLQKDLHRAWKRLAELPIRGDYTIDITRWTRDCGSQKYHAHLLCKHLVQAAGPMDAPWWVHAIRYHIPYGGPFVHLLILAHSLFIGAHSRITTHK